MIKSISLVTLLAMLTLAAIGCANNKKKSEPNASVTDINVAPIPPREAETAYAGPLTGAPAGQPSYYEPAVTQTPGAGAATGGGGSYVVKKGETLFSIAKATYGNGNQWKRIIAANPGLTETNLKAGQTIILP